MNIKVGDLIGSNRYEILEKLGEGGFGVTFLAKDRSSFDRVCVVKHFTYKHIQAIIKTQESYLEKRQEFFRSLRSIHKHQVCLPILMKKIV